MQGEVLWAKDSIKAHANESSCSICCLTAGISSWELTTCKQSFQSADQQQTNKLCTAILYKVSFSSSVRLLSHIFLMHSIVYFWAENRDCAQGIEGFHFSVSLFSDTQHGKQCIDLAGMKETAKLCLRSGHDAQRMHHSPEAAITLNCQRQTFSLTLRH